LAVSIDKRPAQIVSVLPAKDDRLLFAVMLDISSSMVPREKAVKDAAVQIFRGLSNDQSQGYLVLMNKSSYPSKRPLQPSEVEAELAQIRFNGRTALYDGIAQTCTQTLGMSRNPDTPRRVLILLSDGGDNASQVLLDKVGEIAEREGVAIFSLAEYPSSDSEEQERLDLRQFGRDTGGMAIQPGKLGDGVAPLIAAIQGQSVLSIVPSQAADQKLHSLAVKTTEKDLSVSVQAHILLP
jgi:hypothetical protein